MTAVATVISNCGNSHIQENDKPGSTEVCSIWDSSGILFYLQHLSVCWVTYIDSLKTPCQPWNGGSVNKLHSSGDYVEGSGNDLSDRKKHCDDSRCHLLSLDCEPLCLQCTPMRSYNPHFADEKMRQRWVKCRKAIHSVRDLARFKSRSSGPELVIFLLDLMSLKVQK